MFVPLVYKLCPASPFLRPSPKVNNSSAFESPHLLFAFTHRVQCLQSSTPARRQTTTPIKSRPPAQSILSISPVTGTKAAVQVRAQAANGPIYADGPLAANSLRLDPEKLKEVVMYGELAQVGFSVPLVALQLMGSFSHTGESKTFTACFP